MNRNRGSTKSLGKMTRSNTVAVVSHHLKGNPASLNNSNRNISLTQQQYDEYSRFLKATEWDTFNMVIDSRTCDPMTNIVINDTEIRVMVDTGAAANAINEQTYNTMDPKPPLKHLKLPLYGFGNPDKPLTTLGYFSTRLRWRTNQSGAQIVVMKGNSHQNLIGRHTAVELGMVSLNLGQADLNQIGQKLHIIPVKQPLRPIAFHYREAVEKELDKQVAEGILEKVELGHKPITWISNLVVVPKDRKPNANQHNPAHKQELAVRLTCDARPVNKALVRTRYPMKTIDDLI
ncbi:Retrovirus-related Pol poly from transposon, partial [Brachionus plicatilis]